MTAPAGPDARTERLRERIAAARQRAASDAIPRRTATEAVPLTPAQERLWFLDRLDPGAAAYHVCRAVHLRGPVDEAALEAALAALDRRHEALRLHPVEDREGRPRWQEVTAGRPLLARVDLTGIAAARAERVAERLARRLGRRPFPPDPTRRLWRAALLRSAPADRRLVLTLHHLIFDGWSQRVLFDELSHLYRLAAGEALPPLPRHAVGLLDVSAWESASLAGPALEREAAYWRRRLAGFAPLELPGDGPPRAASPASAGLLRRRLDPALAGALERRAREAGAGLFAVLAAAFQVVLGRFAGRRDLGLGFPVANRPRAETETLIGLFVNTLVLRTDLGGDPTLAELLDRVQAATVEALDHQRLPFAWLVRDLAPERSSGRPPLVQALLAVQNSPASRLDLPGVESSIEVVDRGAADADLTLSVEPRDGGLDALLLYRRERFAPTTAERLLRRFAEALAAFAATPDLRLSGLPACSAAERHQVLVEWNDTAAGYPREATLGELFSRQADRRPDAIAVAWEGGALSYRELARRAAGLASALRRRGAGPGSCVAVALARGPELVIALLAVLEAGACYAPLDLGDPAGRLAGMTADLDADLAIGDRDRLAATALAGLAVVGPHEAGPADGAPAPRATAGDPAYVMFTSGSTGRPKGVLVPHRAVARLVLGSRFALLGDDQVWLQAAPPGFDASTLEIWAALLLGGRLALAPAAPRSAAELGELLQREGITSLWLTAGLFHLMVDHQPASLLGLSQLLAGGDVLSPGHVARLAARAPRLHLVNGYGPTENTTFTCCHAVARGAAGAGAVPIGRPIANTRAYVLADDGAPVPRGAFGELYAAGDGVALGYLGRPRASAERFLPDPWGEPGARMYRTGDRVRWLPGGELEFGGRRDGQVKIRGFRVEVGEVEEALAAHPEVARCAVVAAGPPSERRLVAWWVARTPDVPPASELRAFLADRLPEFMVPSALPRRDELPLEAHGKVDRRALAREAEAELAGADRTPAQVAPRGEIEEVLAGLWAEVLGRPDVGVHEDFFLLGGHSLLAVRIVAGIRTRLGVDLPLAALFEHPTVAGLARAVAAAAAGDGRPAEPERAAPLAHPETARAEYRAPGSAAEIGLAELWAEVLGRPRIGLDDDFFELGGHSLLATRIVARIRERFAVDLPLRSLFEHPTVGSLVAIVAAAAPRPAAEPPPPRTESRALPLSYPQQRLWFLDRLEPGGVAYNVPLTLRLSGPLDVAALERALAEIERRHEVLRTTFGEEGGDPVQRVHPPGPGRLARADLAGLAAPGPAADAAAATAARRPFDLQRGPVARALLLRVAEREHRLVVALHHIVSDGASLGIFCRELAALYGAFAAGRHSPLPDLPLQYGDFAAAQRREGGDANWADQLAFWRGRLAGVEPADLPADRPRRTAGTPAGGVVRFAPAIAPAALESVARRHGATLFMAVAAALQALLARHGGGRRFALGIPVAGRPRPDLEALIGFFVNTVVVRADLAGDPSFAELLARVRDETLAALANQDVPFERVVEEVRPDRALGRTPFFQVALTFRGEPLVRPLAGLDVELAGLHGGQAAFDLTLSVGPRDDGSCLDALFEYDATRFDRTTVLRLARHLESLLTAAAAAPDRPVRTLPWAGAAERHQVTVEWAAPAPGEPGTPVEAAIVEVARRRPDAVALRGAGKAAPDGAPDPAAWALTYGELVRRAGQLAGHLARVGVGPEVRVGLWMDRRPELTVALLAVLRAGGAFVALDPALPRSRLDGIAADAGLALVLACGETAQAPPEGLRIVDVAAVWAQEDPPPAPADFAASAWGDRLAYVLYTSGSTGRPKGVGVSARALGTHARQAAGALALTAGDRTLQTASFSFDVALEQLLPGLLAGAEVAFVVDAPWSPADLARGLERLEVTVADLPTGLWREWLEGAAAAVPALRLATVGGEALPAAPAAAWGRSPLAPALLLNAYGPTEATITATLQPVSPAAAARAPGGAVAVGRPLGDRRLHVLGPRGESLPLGAAGELAIGGGLLARGYLGRPAATAERFVPDPSADRERPGSRLYRTGDRVRWLGDGRLLFLGRLDDQVKLRGFRIEPGEIERTLAEHPAVAACAVALAGAASGRPRLIAWAVAAEGATLDAAEARAYLAERLPAYMVPEEIVRLPALPRLPGGKVDRRALPAPAASSARADDGPAPRSRSERAIAGLWRELLGLDRVGLHDNFFDLGGSSLLLMRLQSRLRAELGVEVDLVDLFNHPTVASLAGRLGPAVGGVPGAAPGPRRPHRPDDAIALIGLAGRFPGAADADAMWTLLREGREAIRRFRSEELAARGVDPELAADPGFVAARGIPEDVELFDAAFFGVSPRDAEVMDPQQRLFLELAWEALEVAGYPAGRTARQVGVFAGAAISHYFLHHLLGNAEVLRTVGFHQALSLNEKDTLPTFVSYKLNLAGPSVAVQTACSTSLVAVHLARQSLLAGECELALAGGVTLAMPAECGYLFRPGGILSPDGRCRPFAAEASGTVPGAGAGVVLLKRLADARADGDRVLAVVRGSAINNDGAQKVGFTAPSVDGQAAVVAAALASAGVDPATVGYVEGHGTGTVLGDPIEVAALSRVFAPATERRGFCALGSIKGNLGHLDAAAGVTGLIKATLALHHREIPATLHAGPSHPGLRLAESPFYLPQATVPWPAGDGPRRAGVSSFGVGGTNAHVVLEEAPPAHPSEPGAPWQLLVLSARTAPALDSVAARLADRLESGSSGAAAAELADVAFTLQAGRRAFAHRRFAVCRDRREAVALLRGENGARMEGSVVARWEEETPSVAFLFPGQGAQRPGMGADLYHNEPVFRGEVDRCAELLAPRLGLDLRELLFPAAGASRDEAAARLRPTAVAQPALFVTCYALARQWMAWGIEPAALAGHSVGEYVAACLAGVFELTDALALVAERGRLMGALPPGAMLAVRLDEAALAAELAAYPALTLAAVNEPGSAVVSGRRDAVDRLAARLRGRGVACRPLEVSHAFHSPMMEPAVEPFRRRVEGVALAPPRRPLVANRTGDWLTPAAAVDPAAWAVHLRDPVRWSESIALLAAEPGRIFLEVGPGAALTALVRRHPEVGRGRVAVASLPEILSPAGCEPADLRRALGRLWLAGIEPDWPAVHAPGTRRRVPLPTYPFERRRYWIDAPRRAASIAAPAASGEADAPSRDPAPEPAPASYERPPLATGFVAPRDPVERTIAAVWGELLGIREVGVEDDFLELGGDSLLATQIVARLRAELAVELPVAALFAARTVGGLAAEVAGLGAAAAAADGGAAAALAAVAGLSDEEVEALLRKEEAR